MMAMKRLATVARILAAGTALALAVPAASEPSGPSDPPWWKGAVIYEVYPRSFADSNGDGVGDLAGITAHLDYLQSLGVDAIWLAPMFPSPQVDFGYDVSDFRGVDPQYGSLADLDRLQAEAAKRGIRVLLDFVINHTSDQHPWFAESRRSRSNPRADWYVWNDGIAANGPGVTALQRRNTHDGRVPPNNWTSVFGGSAWEWEPARKQFYYHKFYRQQPDLNWDNPAVEAAMFDVVRFWLDRGIAGFRLDAVPTAFEDPQLANAREIGGTDPFGDPRLDESPTYDQPRVHGLMKRLRALVDSYPGNRVLVGETYVPNAAALAKWYGGTAQDELHLAMDMAIGFGPDPKYTPAHFRPLLADAQQNLAGGQPLIVFDNHDQVRSIDRFADGVHDVAIAQGIATILLASRDTALTYYGAPLGMRTRTPTRRDDVKDPVGITGWPKEKGRDGERTPMQWTAGPQAGFSTRAATWLPVNPDYRTVNVAAALKDPHSLLRWHQRLIALRRSEPSLRGAMTMIDPANPAVLGWVRQAPGAPAVVAAINMSGQPRAIRLDPAELGGRSARTLAKSASTIPAKTALGSVVLPPFASWIARIEP